MNRRKFLSTIAAVGLAGPLMAQTPRPRRILLRSSWQTENIGDIAHTPGVLALIEKHLSGVEVRLWPSSFWLTDEAISTYVRSAGLFGNEMHSPIMSIGNGIPAIVCRWDTQTSKGFMWRDIGLDEWLIDFDKEAELEKVVPTVLAMAKNPVAAKEKARKAGDRVRGLFAASMGKVKENLG